MFNTRKGKNIYKLQLELENLYPDSKVVILNSARAGIIIALKVFQQKKPQCKEVIIPEFICDSVPNVIKKMGLTPIYGPVGADLNLQVSALNHLCNENTLAVILPHMYAKPAKIVEADELLTKRGIFLIDDAAQVSGIGIENKALGSWGDVGLLSFAQAKTIVTGVRASGGVMFINNKSLIKNIYPFVELLPDCQSRISSLVHFLLAYKWHGVSRQLDYYLQRIKHKFFSHTIIDNYSPITRISNLDAGIALAQFNSLKLRIEKTSFIISNFKTMLEDNHRFEIVQAQAQYLSRLIIQSKELSPDKLKQKLKAKGIVTKFVYGTGSKPYDGAHLSGLIELPLQNLNDKQLKYIINILKTV
ncbi:DegT/DnrJ/EryC1/StrS family aminotransferase [Colwelliaceae bacterium MEBiC 14330]